MRKEHDALSPGWYCSICQQKAGSSRRWFAIVQDPAGDRLSIFHREDLAGPLSIHNACSPAHVRELVIHWMVTGNLNYPFADAVARQRTFRGTGGFYDWIGGVTQPLVPIGELSVDRDAIQRVLYENPAGLEVMLEELNDALEKSIAGTPEQVTLADLSEALIPHI